MLILLESIIKGKVNVICTSEENKHFYAAIYLHAIN